MSGPIRVFVGSSPRHVVPERVLVHSILSRTNRPVEINVIDTIADEIRRIDPDGTARSLPLPIGWKQRMFVGGSGFHYARFAPPQLCHSAGRAIYLEADQVVLGDVAELWEFPLGGASCAAVPADRVRGRPHSHQQGGYASSVLLYDCARASALDALEICEASKTPGWDWGEFSMADDFLRRTGLSVAPLPAQWNDHEQRFPDTKLLHFTFQESWPVDTPCHPESRVWIDEYLAAVDAGWLDHDTLDRALEQSAISVRVRTLARLPRWATPAVDLVWQRGEYLYLRARRAAGMAKRAAERLLGRSLLWSDASGGGPVVRMTEVIHSPPLATRCRTAINSRLSRHAGQSTLPVPIRTLRAPLSQRQSIAGQRSRWHARGKSALRVAGNQLSGQG